MEVQGRIWIKENNKNFLGHGKVELLERIAESGSIAKAAREMKMSYKAAKFFEKWKKYKKGFSNFLKWI